MGNSYGLDDFRIYNQSKQLRSQIFHQIIKKLPKEETFLLKDQISRASRSVCANLAEGYGHYYFRETSRFCRSARASLYEVLDHLSVCLELEILNQKEYTAFEESIYSLIKQINAYINYLKSKDTK